MKYRKVVPAEFLRRPNRFVAVVKISGKEETVHVKNTGRCRELLIPGCHVYLSESDNPERKTRYDLIAVEKRIDGETPLLINMDSQIPNDAVGEWLKKGSLFPENARIRREVQHENSRFDFCVELPGKTCFLEVKGVTLERNGIALFPDAPTERGVKHLRELIKCKNDGMDAFVVFVIQMKRVRRFRPNDEMHKEFGQALRDAAAAGVQILAMDCVVTPDSIEIDQPVKVDLGER